MENDPRHICCWHVVGHLKPGRDGGHGPYAPGAISGTGRPMVSRCCHCRRQETSTGNLVAIPDEDVDFYASAAPQESV